MSKRTGIAWTDATWNPWMGCTKVSPGCARCYMFRDQRRFRMNPQHVRRTMPATFDAPRTWHEPQRVFTCSWSDFFHPAADAWRADAWAIIRDTPHLTYQILTKRPERIEAQLPADWGVTGYHNVWLGVSVELQRHADRIATLDNIRCFTKFVSAEPLLGPLDLPDPLDPVGDDERFLIDALDWVIAGGESGPRARPCQEDWLRTLAAQCAYHATPFFLKQLGGHPNARAHELAVLDGRTWTEIPAALR